MQTYTSQQGGYTPQGQAVAAGQPNAVNTAPPPGSPASSYGSDQQLNQQFATANANNVNLALPETRQGFISNSTIPAQQTNYDDIAKQLFEYDQGVLSPKFQGVNPGIPSDAASFGRVDASPLGMTVQGAGLPASEGLYAGNNPKGAYQAQIAQGNSIADLLGVLNRGIGDTFSSTKGLYANKTDAAQKALDTIIKLMTLKQDALDKASTASSKGETPQDVQNRLISDAKKGTTFQDLVLRYTPDGLTPSQIRDLYNQVNYYKKPATESDSDVIGLINGTKPSAQQAKEKAAQQKSDAYNITKSTIQNLLGQYKSLGPLDKGGPAASLLAMNPLGAGSNYEKQRRGLVVALKDVAGAGAGSGVRVTNAEIQGWMNLLPSPGDTSENAKKNILSLDKQLRSKFGTGLDPEYIGASKGTILMTGARGTFNVPADKVELFKKNGYK